MGHVWVEGLRTVPGSGNGRFLDVDPIAQRVGGAENDCRRGAHRGNAMALGFAIHADHECVGADDLWVV